MRRECLTLATSGGGKDCVPLESCPGVSPAPLDLPAFPTRSSSLWVWHRRYKAAPKILLGCKRTTVCAGRAAPSSASRIHGMRHLHLGRASTGSGTASPRGGGTQSLVLFDVQSRSHTWLPAPKAGVQPLHPTVNSSTKPSSQGLGKRKMQPHTPHLHPHPGACDPTALTHRHLPVAPPLLGH